MRSLSAWYIFNHLIIGCNKQNTLKYCCLLQTPNKKYKKMFFPLKIESGYIFMQRTKIRKKKFRTYMITPKFAFFLMTER